VARARGDGFVLRGGLGDDLEVGHTELVGGAEDFLQRS